MTSPLPDALPDHFSYREALAAGLTKHHLYSLRDAGIIELISRGFYQRTDRNNAIDLNHAEIARRVPQATLCLTTALTLHQLSDANPATIDVAVPAGYHRPHLAAPVTWHQFSRATFEVGRGSLLIDATTSIGLYGPERSIIDAFRLRQYEGEEFAFVALRRWLRRPGSSPAALYDMARHFPRTLNQVSRALEIFQYE